jgi:predicted AlkP superfamily pyrophosphatase or phosphodiesterase
MSHAGRLLRFALALPLTLALGTSLHAQNKPPYLVVFITVDQLKPDYLDKFGSQFTGGFARLLNGGAFYTNAFHDHAITETAPGHSVMMAGRFPRGTGIMTNDLGVNDPRAKLLGVSGGGASPFRFRGTTLMDWMRVNDPESRALSVSRKDRAAILPLGRAKENVYWYVKGQFTTSTYYADTLPRWVRRFNERRVPVHSAGRAWTLLLPERDYPEPDFVAVENEGKNQTFPHSLTSDTSLAKTQFIEFPWMDEYTLAFAMQGLHDLNLGRGPHADLLAVSLSTNDDVGHRYGPDSREVHDEIVRLDRTLGVFLDSLFKVRDSTRIIIALTSDHGVAPFPEIGNPPDVARRMHVDYKPLLDSARARLAERGVADTLAFRFDSGVLIVNREALARRGVDADWAVEDFARRMRELPGVARVQRVQDLPKGDTIQDAITRRWLHAVPTDLPAELVMTLKPYHVWRNVLRAEHGMPYDYDAHVPVIFYGPPFRSGRQDELARVVDMAPTLARVLGVNPTEPLDGHVLWSSLR